MSVPPGRPARRLTGPQILLIAVVSVLVLLLVVLLVQRATSDGTGTADGQDPAPPAAATADDTAGTGAEPDDEAVTDEAGDVPGPAGTGAEVEPTYFASPSGNIACVITVDSADCVIATFTYDAVDAADCEREDAGGHLRVEAAGASMPCEPLVVAGDVPALPYGESVTAHGFTCDSEESGVSCRHDTSGYGFAVARADYSLS